MTRDAKTGAWSATIDHADGEVHEDVPVSVTQETEQGLAAAFDAAIKSCP